MEEKTERFARIKYFKELHTSAGGGAWNDEEGFEYMYIHYEGLNSFSHAQEASLHAINVIGDSMEPTLKDKEIILCDTTCKEFEDGDIFMIHTLEGLFVKRLFQDAKGTISLRSDNPNYTPTCINKLGLDDITLIGKVIAKVEKELCR
ncbi:S24 family peptidase (plasmid) [Sulfurospirillum diekertiae]|uniref:S24 family peptidase n=1 Tax=Sulfurospirillum diekertiae TaxID=1854492 RepID=UPI00142793C3|nr:S24 family peptidase [Sulfurospirillum diekertiae]QIR80018.1 S24 family peptidase [Sulfurospirillum diekertiae]